MSFGKLHVASSADPPKVGTQNGACGKEVRNAIPWDSVETTVEICKDCAANEKVQEFNGLRYYTVLIPGEKLKQQEAEG